MADPLKLYRFLLKLYPARFREEYGSPLEQQFSDEYRDADGALARLAVWMRTLRDLAISIPLELGRELRQDLRYSVRIYSKRPGVTFLAVAAMALAIGATTGVFSVVNALLLRSLPFRAPERMVQLGSAFAAMGSAEFHGWRKRSAYLEDAAAYDQAEMNLSGAAEATRVKVTETSFNFFSMIGSEPEIGRSFAAGEDAPGKNAVAVIGYGLWQQFFGGDPRALGSIISLNGTPLTVIGIARPGLDYPAKTAVWTPTVFEFERVPKTGVTFWVTVGHLKPGLTSAQGESMFEAEEERRSPGSMRAVGVNRPRLVPLREQLAGPVAPHPHHRAPQGTGFAIGAGSQPRAAGAAIDHRKCSAQLFLRGYGNVGRDLGGAPGNRGSTRPIDIAELHYLGLARARLRAGDCASHWLAVRSSAGFAGRPAAIG
jgi:hypothetical protein